MADMTNEYNTQLTAQEEHDFQRWAYGENKLRDLYDYDLRGAWKELQSGQMTEDERGHLGDRYKKPNHPTFSDQSIYSNGDTTGGTWTEDAGGNTTYTPSVHVLQQHNVEELQWYFDNYESGSTLQLPAGTD